MILVVDVETTGLRPTEGHEVVDLAFAKYDPQADTVPYSDLEVVVKSFQARKLELADSAALRINRYYDRRPEFGPEKYKGDTRYHAFQTFVRQSAGAYLAGCQPHFDAKFMEAELRDHGLAPAWHHRLIDVESMAMGILKMSYPPGLDELRDIFKVPDSEPSDRHTAEGDVRATIFVLQELNKRIQSGEEPTRQMEVPSP